VKSATTLAHQLTIRSFNTFPVLIAPSLAHPKKRMKMRSKLFRSEEHFLRPNRQPQIRDIVEEMSQMIGSDGIQDDKYISPCPGPCRNDELITYHHPSQQWRPKKNLVFATKERAGHYCKVNEETWNLFKSCSENSGPAMRFDSTDRVCHPASLLLSSPLLSSFDLFLLIGCSRDQEKMRI
jgi:hypothetical protein